MIDTRQATRADVPGVAAALARAFDDDPVMRWLFCADPRRRAARMTRFFADDVQRMLAHDGVVTTEGHEGGALWAPPGRWRVRWPELVRSSPTMVRVLNLRLPRGLRLFNAMEKIHPREPHWYLAILGTEPEARGRGIGGALMRPVLDRCDREGLGSYLESSKEGNIPYYERFGYRVTGEITMPGGPTLWPMWRDPAEPPVEPQAGPPTGNGPGT